MTPAASWAFLIICCVAIPALVAWALHPPRPVEPPEWRRLLEAIEAGRRDFGDDDGPDFDQWEKEVSR